MRAGRRSTATPSSSGSRSACTTACTAAPATEGRWASPSASTTRRAACTNAELLVASVRPQDVVLLHDPQTAGMIPRVLDTGASVIWRSHIGVENAERSRARGLALPHPVRRARRRVRLHRRGISVGRPGPCEAHRDPALDRRVLAEEPSDGLHRHHRGASRGGSRRGQPRRPTSGVRAHRRHRAARAQARRARRGAAAPPRRPARCCRSRAGIASRTRSACSPPSPSTCATPTSPICCSPGRTWRRSPTTPRDSKRTRRCGRRGWSCPAAYAGARTSRFCRWTTPTRTR